MRSEGPGDSPPFDRREASEAPAFRCASCGASVAAEAGTCPHCQAHLATRRCLRCFALGPAAAVRCGRCGALLPSAGLAAPASGSCPDCRQPLVSRSFGAVGYLECGRCGGLFLGSQAFGAVTGDAETRGMVRAAQPEAAHGPGVGSTSVRYRPCPLCRKLMNRTNWGGGSGVIVDTCGRDGVWFDRGELTAIVAFVESGGAEKLRQREKERLREEVAALESRKGFEGAVGLPASAADREGLGVEILGQLLGFLGRVFRR